MHMKPISYFTPLICFVDIDMDVSSILHVILLLSVSFQCSSSSSSSPSLNGGFSLSVEKPEDVIISQNGVFSAGFYAVGENAYVFSVWFAQNPTVVWTANRDHPVNGKRSSLSLHTGNLVLSDAGQFEVWSTGTTSSLPAQLILNNSGNLVLYELKSNERNIVWQSFDFPTNTLLPEQQLTRFSKLVSDRSITNHSSGYYKLSFDDENVLSLLYDGPDVSSKYWPVPWLLSWDAGRLTFNSRRIAVLDSLGSFNSTDNFGFKTSDYGVAIERRMKLDSDGNIRVYSLQNNNEWEVTWQAISDPCIVHGLCGANSTCMYDPREGRKCSCLPGYRVKNHSDWSHGCEPKFQLSCDKNESTFIKLPDVELYGYDYFYKENISYSDCENACLKDCECRAFQYSFNDDGLFQCYTKRVLLNGHRSPGFRGTTCLRLPKTRRNDDSFFEDEESAQEDGHVCSVKLERGYAERHVSSLVKFFLWLSVAIGVFEVIFISITGFSLKRTKQNSDVNRQGYNFLSPFGFRRYTYSELKQATKGFTEEIGRGASGIVYKGVLPDQRIAAIKKLHNENIGTKRDEADFLAEVSIIGRLNHMNLIEMWGYCAEGKHRLLVYEFMEKGSLAENLKSNTLDWTKRYNIALRTARVLAYLHEECLEWILHCDIKPQNILLDSNYQPKVADFGLSKLLNRNDQNTENFSVIRGTRGYMAPEWVLNLQITSKVDVYSFGIVVLEMITGRSVMTVLGSRGEEGEEATNGKLVEWVREKKKKTTSLEEGPSSSSSCCWVEQIIDAAMIGSKVEVEKRKKMETLASVALECVEDDRDARPTMSQVVEMLQSHEDACSS